jgi:hypothetical protein
VLPPVLLLARQECCLLTLKAHYGANTRTRTEKSYLEGRRFAISLHSHLEVRVGAAPTIPIYKIGVIASVN